MTTDLPPSGDEIAPKRRRAPKGEMRRTALLDAATEVIAQYGYFAASMRDIADRAGITGVGLLHHFPNKVELLKALLNRRDERVIENFARLQTKPTLSGFLDFLRMSMTFSIASESECQASLMINVESLSDHHPAFPWYREKFEMVHGHAQGHIAQLIEAGEIRKNVDVRSLAQEIFSLMDGLQIHWLRARDQVDVMKVFDGYLARLSETLKPMGLAHP